MARPNLPEDTIAAIATAQGFGGIGVVRVSGPVLGPLVFALTGKIPPPRMASLMCFAAADGSTIDQGIVLHFPAPHSYTGQDVVEFQAHGGPVVLELLLARCVELGARLAEPGEFTRRAFLNGKLDLAQAESVADLIAAATAQAARSAVRSLSGVFSEKVHALEKQLIDLRMLVEAMLDFPDEEIDFLDRADAGSKLASIRASLESVVSQAKQGSLLRNGMRVVLAGLPNVGKSSLLNRLAGEDRAIVTEIPGTTRDALREQIQIEGIPLHVIDTAGLRDTVDAVERLGIQRSWQEIEQADVILHLVDASSGWALSDDEIEARLPQGVTHIVVANKIDLCGRKPVRETFDGRIWISISAMNGAGLDLLRTELLRLVGWRTDSEDVFLARERHLVALRESLAHVTAAAECISAAELFAEELRLAQVELAAITGEFTADDLLGEIFSRFCIGK